MKQQLPPLMPSQQLNYIKALLEDIDTNELETAIQLQVVEAELQTLISSINGIQHANQVVLGKKFDQEKTQYHLMPLNALELINRVLMHGANKYGANNWQQVEGWEYRYYNAALRHLLQWQAGEKVDAESGISHLAHAICSLMFLIEKES